MTLRDMRVEHGDSYRGLADAAEVPFQSLTRWESGERDPRQMRLSTARRLADALDMSLDQFWDGLH